MYSNDRYRIPETSPGRRYSDHRMPSSGRPLPPDPRDSVRPPPRDRSLEIDRRRLEMDRKDRSESFGRQSQEFDYNHGHPPERHVLDRNRLEDEGKRKMAEELKIREQQLAITSNLLQKQSDMLKNMEANMIAQNRPGPVHMMGRNLGPPGPNLGPLMDIRPDSRSPRRKFEWNPEVPKFARLEKDRYDGPPPKRFKEIEQDDRSNWKKAVQSRGGKTRMGGHMQGGPVTNILCITCKSSNHVARFCPRATKVNENGPSKDNVCNLCKSPNHFARDCPNHKRTPNFDNVSGPIRNQRRPPAGFNKTASRFGSSRGGRRQFRSEQFKRTFTGNRSTKNCKPCSEYCISDYEAHLKTPEHIKMFELCRAGCKLCNKKRYNSKPQYDKHQISPLHKALVGKKKLVVDAKLKPFSPSNTSGVEYVVPVSGYFCKLCKKFYNKESYAKVDHCKSKPHYDKVASIIGTKFDTAIGARFQDIKDKLTAEVTDPKQLERKLIEAVRKADFVTDLKPIPIAKKTVVPTATTVSEKTAETTQSPEEQIAKTDKEDEPHEDAKETEEESEEKPAEDGDHEHPDDLENMEVLDDLGVDDGAGAE